MNTPDVESILFQPRLCHFLSGEGINQPPRDSCQDTFKDCKPTAFTLCPYGNIHRHFLECHQRGSGEVVHRDNYFQCYSSNFTFCSWGGGWVRWKCGDIKETRIMGYTVLKGDRFVPERGRGGGGGGGCASTHRMSQWPIISNLSDFTTLKMKTICTP